MKSYTNNIIEELWYGNIDPLNSGVFKTLEIKNLVELISQNKINLEKTLNNEQKKFEKYIDCNSDLLIFAKLPFFNVNLSSVQR